MKNSRYHKMVYYETACLLRFGDGPWLEKGIL